jgi:hypothetical protein
VSEGRPRRWGRIIAAVVIVAVTIFAGWWWTRPTEGLPPATRIARVVPESVRIKVEVLNATDTRGLARTAMFALRDAGFDVVYFGNTSERHDSTVVRDRSGHPQWAELARGVMAPAIAEVRADSGRLVDLTILIGARWRPPAEPFRP